MVARTQTNLYPMAIQASIKPLLLGKQRSSKSRGRHSIVVSIIKVGVNILCDIHDRVGSHVPYCEHTCIHYTLCIVSLFTFMQSDRSFNDVKTY
ncbi:hypothetical protein ECG_08221 [Echinococcus granulosus]|uniref:Ovule protein n=1 Tax=Echinococcus granulosus TaxID=6210 RepID=A0A068X4L4_ECHGR|nr:hypothetical protein ECG_08221 [Echinococcus granulosus]CDS24956.1 hypothetical protein EgrG_002005600 [Echinococcus granulosus]